MGLALLLTLTSAAQDELRVTMRDKICDGQALVAFSRDGQRFVACRHAGNGEYAYLLGEVGGKEPREIHKTRVAWNDVLLGQITPDAFSADGTRLVLLGAAPKADGRGHVSRCVVADLKGAVEVLKPEKAEAWFGTWSPVEDALYLVETQDYRGAQPGYSIRRYRPGTQSFETLHENADQLPLHLRPSPDGKRLAFLSASLAARRKAGEVRLKVLTIGDRSVVESEPFYLDDYVADASPALHWDPNGKGVYFHRSPDADKPAGAERYQPAFFDIEKRRAENLADDHTAPIMSVLDAKHLLVLAGTTDRGQFRTCVLRVTDKKKFPLPEGLAGSGAIGSWIAVYDPKAKATFHAQVEMPR